MIFETNDNYSIQFEMQKKHYSHSTMGNTAAHKNIITSVV